MANNPKYYIVEASALPEVFLKVAEAKRMLSTGEASTVNEATQLGHGSTACGENPEGSCTLTEAAALPKFPITIILLDSFGQS